MDEDLLTGENNLLIGLPKYGVDSVYVSSILTLNLNLLYIFNLNVVKDTIIRKFFPKDVNFLLLALLKRSEMKIFKDRANGYCSEGFQPTQWNHKCF